MLDREEVMICHCLIYWVLFWVRLSLKAENAEIFWGDETAVQNVANYVRGYAPKGQTPVVKVQAQKMQINMISAISNQGKLHFLLHCGTPVIVFCAPF